MPPVQSSSLCPRKGLPSLCCPKLSSSGHDRLFVGMPLCFIVYISYTWQIRGIPFLRFESFWQLHIFYAINALMIQYIFERNIPMHLQSHNPEGNTEGEIQTSSRMLHVFNSHCMLKPHASSTYTSILVLTMSMIAHILTCICLSTLLQGWKVFLHSLVDMHAVLRVSRTGAKRSVATCSCYNYTYCVTHST